jgi:glycosyltransferase involved in cell wall biosynthesis
MKDRFRKPLVSVVIPAHGRRELLAETLNSLFAQTLQDWEAIVVDDGGPESNIEWLRQFAGGEPRVRAFAREGDRGGANVCRNQGAAQSAGKYVVFLDSDDLLEPECLFGRTRHLEARPDLDFSVRAMRCFASEPGDTDRAWNTLTAEDDFERFLLMDGPWQTTGPTWRRSALPRVGPWDPDLLSLQDLDFHARAVTAGLRYDKINAWDCHYRLPHRRKSITSAHRSLAQCRSHVRIADRLLAVADPVLDATPHRRGLLAGFCFLIAGRCARKGDLPAALRLWNAVRRRGLVPGTRFLEGAAVLLAGKFPSVSKPAHDIVVGRWPQTLRMNFRDTYLNAALPPRAADACCADGSAPPRVRAAGMPPRPALAV